MGHRGQPVRLEAACSDTRVEAWMLATLAFRWRQAFERGKRISEWFQVPDLAEDELVKVLDEVYGLVPE